MKRLLLCLMLLTGCENLQHQLGIHNGHNEMLSVQPAKDRTILLKGQSNPLYFSQFGGTEALTTALQSFAPGKITYIVCAKGGTNMQDDWQVGAPLDLACAAKIGKRKIDLEIYWQSESEAEIGPWSTNAQEMWDMWEPRLVGLVHADRARTGNPDMPVFYCRLGDLTGLPGYKVMYTLQTHISLDNSRMIDLDGIPVEGLHYLVGNGYSVVANRFADAYRMYLRGE